MELTEKQIGMVKSFCKVNLLRLNGKNHSNIDENTIKTGDDSFFISHLNDNHIFISKKENGKFNITSNDTYEKDITLGRALILSKKTLR